MNPIKQVIALLLALQILFTLYMWAVTLVGTMSEGRFAVFLAIDLLSFAVVAYVYTHQKWEEAVNRVWILAGSIGLIILLVSSLYLV
jgi:succinate-acetate transporter protein